MDWRTEPDDFEVSSRESSATKTADSHTMLRPKRGSARARLMGFGVSVAVILVAVGCYPAIHPDNRPTAIGGARNGELTPSQLVTVTSSCSIYWRAAAYYSAMVRDAAAEGVSVSATECYRTLIGQQDARDYWCSFDLCHFAAVPGTSIHGWAKAEDLRDETGGLGFESITYG